MLRILASPCLLLLLHPVLPIYTRRATLGEEVLMRFDWMNSPAESPRQRDPASRARALSHEVRQRAGLFKRMGYPKAHAIHRCLGNIAWAYAQAGKPPVSAAEVRRIVEHVYKR